MIAGGTVARGLADHSDGSILPTFRFFVLAHNDETLERVPVHRGIEPVDLRTLVLEERWRSNQFAETRFLLSEESSRMPTEFVGLASPSFRDKWPDEPPLEFLADRLPHSRLLNTRSGLAPSLSRGNWIEEAESYHPGMGPLLNEVIDARRLRISFHRVPQANTFVCSRETFLDLRHFAKSILTDVVDRYGEDLPFSYRCRFCGTASPDGVGRYGRDRHVGFFAERVTMLYFAQRPEIRFRPPRTILPKGYLEYQAAETARAVRSQAIAWRRQRARL